MLHECGGKLPRAARDIQYGQWTTRALFSIEEPSRPIVGARENPIIGRCKRVEGVHFRSPGLAPVREAAFKCIAHESTGQHTGLFGLAAISPGPAPGMNWFQSPDTMVGCSRTRAPSA